MNTSINHPSAAQLREFGLGRLSDELMEVVSEHVAYCDTCCQKLEQVHDDTLVELCKAAEGETAVEGLKLLDDSSLADAQAALEAAFADHPRYRLRSPLGHGGMGLVYKAEHRLMDRMVAIKVIHPALTANANAIDRFQREIRAAGKLNHPNIVAALDAEQTGPYHCLIMEFAPGVSLDRIVKHRGVLHVAGACRIIKQAAMGLAHAHRRGMVHRDIKPHNLLATLDGQVKILDFGLARFASEQRASNDLTGDGMLGTPEYMSPEQIQRANDADIRSDIYSLGCTLYYLLAGRSPFFESGQSAAHLLMAHLQQEPPPLSQVRQDVPPRLEQFLARILAKDPAQRPQTPEAVIVSMEEIIRGAASYSPPESGSVFDDASDDSGVNAPIELTTSPTEALPESAAANLSEIAAELGAAPGVDPLTIDPASQRRLQSRRRQRMSTPPWVWLAGALLALLAAAFFLPTDGGGERPRVLMFVPDRYWSPDYHPLRAALESHLRMDDVSVRRQVTEYNGGPTLQVALRPQDVRPEDYAGLIVIGGEQMSVPPIVQTLFQAFRADNEKFVAAICRGQVIAQQAGVLNGARVSQIGEFNTTQDESRLHRVPGKSCVVDEQQQLITATDETDVTEFAHAIRGWIAEKAR